MSIRVEECSRFSLRTSLLGEASSPVAMQPLAPQPMVRQAPAAAAPTGARTLTFKNLVTAPLVAAAPPAAPVKYAPTTQTAHVLASIAHAQRRATALPVVAPPRAANDNRLLPSGYVSGGNVSAGAQAEVMRLTATLDALQAQMGAQGDRLAKTEASLVRANRTMSSERATANARLLRMQTELQDLRVKEGKLREQAATRIFADPARSQTSFDASVKRVQEFDSKIADLTEAVARISAERDAMAKRAETNGVVAAERAAALQTIGGERDVARKSRDDIQERLTTSSQTCATLEETLADARSDKEAVEAQATAAAADHAEGVVQLRADLAKLAERLEAVGAERDAVVRERAELQARVDTAAAADAAALDTAAAVEAVDVSEAPRAVETAAAADAGESVVALTHDSHQVELLSLQTRVDALLQENDELQREISALTPSSLLEENKLLRKEKTVVSDAAAALRDDVAALTNENERLRTEHAAPPADLLNLMDEPATGGDAVPEQALAAKPSVERAPRVARGAARAATALRAAVPFGVGVPRAPPPGHAHALLDAEMDAATGAGTNDANPDVVGLIKAISEDVRTAWLRERRKYLLATGMEESKVDTTLLQYAT